MCINEQHDLFVQRLMRESITCGLKLEEGKISCSPREGVLPMLSGHCLVQKCTHNTLTPPAPSKAHALTPALC